MPGHMYWLINYNPQSDTLGMILFRLSIHITITKDGFMRNWDSKFESKDFYIFWTVCHVDYDSQIESKN